MSIVELVKKSFRLDKKDNGNLITPILVFFFAGAVNVLNAQIFGGMTSIEALKEGLILGASAGGVYSMGKVYLDKVLDKQAE